MFNFTLFIFKICYNNMILVFHMQKKLFSIVSVCLLTCSISAISFAAVDFDNSNFSPNFTNLLVKNNSTIKNLLTVENILKVKNIFPLDSIKGENNDIIIGGQVQFNEAIFGDNGDLRISSDVSITGDVQAVNISSNSINTSTTYNDNIISNPGSNLINIKQNQDIFQDFTLRVNGEIEGDKLQPRGYLGSTYQANIYDITRTINKIKKLGENTTGATYVNFSAANASTGFKTAYCNPGDLLLSCSTLVFPGAVLINTTFLAGNSPQGCQILVNTNPSYSGSTYNNVTALCFDLD